MAKIIVFCADGTWNGPGEADHDDTSGPPTNVFKLFLNLQGTDTPATLPLAKEQERVLTNPDKTVVQIAKYLHGVGDSNNFLVHLLGGSLGDGLITRIVRGYTFISRNFQPGDRIFITGFSRGAYTARALAGLINNQGLLNAATVNMADKQAAYRLGAAAWYAWRKTVRTTSDWLGRLEDFVVDLPLFFSKPPSPEQRIKATIDAVAVWDTVGALGIPTFAANGARLDVFQFADLNLPAIVSHGAQAIAVDEQRDDFTPTLWNADPRVTQMLFPGAHSDVGGGQPTSDQQSGLSDCALVWLTEQLADAGVLFAKLPAPGQPNPLGVAHQPWNDPPWNLLRKKLRVLPAGLSLSQCLLDRYHGGPVKACPTCAPVLYRPANLSSYLPAVA